MHNARTEENIRTWKVQKGERQFQIRPLHISWLTSIGMHNGPAEEKYRKVGNANKKRTERKSGSGNPEERGPNVI